MFKTIFDLITTMGLTEAPWTSWSEKSGFFWAEISDGCAYVCKYFLVGCAARRDPKGSYLREKSCPTSLRYLVLKIMDFESTKIRDFIPPPDNTWTRSFKASFQIHY